MNPTIQALTHNGLDFELRRSKRRKRSISLVVRASGKVVVMAPFDTSLAHVQRLLTTKKDWVLKQQFVIRDEPAIRFDEGDQSVLFLGDKLKLAVVQSNRSNIERTEDGLAIYFEDKRPSSAQIPQLLNHWLKQQAEVLFAPRVKFWSEEMNLMPPPLQVKQYKARWGSCTRAGVVQLNWRLIGAPVEVIDYVIVHELAHLAHFNHSKSFWGLVGSTINNYSLHRAWLKKNGSTLNY